MIIKWNYHYVKKCAYVNVEDMIDLTPDKHGRWQIRGHITSSELEFPVNVVTIQFEYGAFVAKFLVFDYNLGLSFKVFRSDSVNELMIEIQNKMDNLKSIINGA